MDSLTREEYFAIYKKEKDRRCEMATAIRMGRDEVRQEGRMEGLKEGLKEGRIEDARNLKALGVSAEIIEKATGLTREQVETL